MERDADTCKQEHNHKVMIDITIKKIIFWYQDNIDTHTVTINVLVNISHYTINIMWTQAYVRTHVHSNRKTSLCLYIYVQSIFV